LQGLVKRINDSTVLARDHLGGFNSDYENNILDSIESGTTVYTEYIFSDVVKNQYPNLNLRFDAELMIRGNCLEQLSNLAQTFIVDNRTFIPEVGNGRITHFLCCFNRSAHVSREWAVSWLHHLNWFNPYYCSKHFPIQHHFCHTHPDLKTQYQNHTFDQTFLNSIVMFDYNGTSTDHRSHLQVLSPKIQQCFVQLVTETVSESYCPFPTEKFLYPILNKTLWVAYAQPGYHQFIEQHMGFKQYQTFDYEFDNIADPLNRLKAITDMLAPFAQLSRLDWHDIYLVEKDTMDHNLELIRTGSFVNKIRSFNERAN
jgi:hypothetical protein